MRVTRPSTPPTKCVGPYGSEYPSLHESRENSHHIAGGSYAYQAQPRRSLGFLLHGGAVELLRALRGCPEGRLVAVDDLPKEKDFPLQRNPTRGRLSDCTSAAVTRLRSLRRDTISPTRRASVFS